MNDLATLAADLDAAEAALLEMPQVEIPTTHDFPPGLYLREITMPAGALVIGHAHRGPTLNIMLKGRIAVVDGDGVRREIAAPFRFVSPPGRKIALVLEETVWMNILPNPDDETDVEVLEDRYTDRTDAWLSQRERAELALLTAEGAD
ncbi:hypothetical protein [Amaricoccus solimangrovi]|uniref:Cupin n=1 Tax=Amaricoccus solimangrovi TaxID=2589815 RepID=A0A501WZC0_9RHOB|nr:hypothetical protein [Amaricoccus solimangrovi]TPE53077.1 hypothetical protein FJM51_03370 [Amaricoccus solimangrovi]